MSVSWLRLLVGEFDIIASCVEANAKKRSIRCVDCGSWTHVDCMGPKKTFHFSGECGFGIALWSLWGRFSLWPFWIVAVLDVRHRNRPIAVRRSVVQHTCIVPLRVVGFCITWKNEKGRSDSCVRQCSHIFGDILRMWLKMSFCASNRATSWQRHWLADSLIRPCGYSVSNLFLKCYRPISIKKHTHVFSRCTCTKYTIRDAILTCARKPT